MINYGDESFKEFSKEEEEQILLDLITHIEAKTEGSITDYIIDFCNTKEYRIEEIAYLIKDNKTLSAILKQDCLYHGILRNETPKSKLEDW